VAPERPVDRSSGAVVGDDRRAFNDESAYPAQIIEVIMRVDEIADRLAREGSLDFGDHGERALLIEWAQV